MDPFINPLNIVVDDIGDITLEPSVGQCMIINTSASQVQIQVLQILKLQDLRSQQKVI
jgi:hypothetical protein